MALGIFTGDGTVGGPDNGPAKGQNIAEWAGDDIVADIGNVQPAFTPQHPADAHNRKQQAGHDPQIAFLLIEQDRKQNGQARPEIVDHPDLNGLMARGGIAKGEGEAHLVADKQDATSQQVTKWKAPHGGKANRRPKQHAA